MKCAGPGACFYLAAYFIGQKQGEDNRVVIRAARVAKGDSGRAQPNVFLRLRSDALEPLLINPDGFYKLFSDLEAKLFQLLCKFPSVDQINWRGSVSCGLFHRRRSERPCRYKQAFVRPANHRPSKIPDLAGAHRLCSACTETTRGSSSRY